MSTARRDQLTDIEQRMQARWAKDHTYESDAPPLAVTDAAAAVAAQPKYFITFPYPYMNGKLHLGHCFSLTKSEFAARFWRMKGRHVLWPFGLHVTGTPIAACAQKLANEIRMFGNPPQFPAEFLEEKAAAAAEKAADAPGKHKSKRGKTAPPKPQWTIMEGMGLTAEEIVKFTDTRHWLNYFPGMAVEDLKAMGCHIDFRRSFITTDVNPYYDSFVQWQFKKLQEAGYLKWGKRYSVYSPLDGQPCADHDRASGEGVVAQEYTVVKLRVQKVEEQEALKPFLDIIAGRSVILPGATLRPETVVGQTNCWMSPNFPYKAYAVKNEAGTEDIYLMTAKAARNMLYQGFVINGQTATDVEPLFEVDGAKLIGLPLTAPLSPYATIYTLPMATITESKGTGVVMSVPSDSPDDYINFVQLVNKPEYRAKLGLKDEWVMPFTIVPILEIPDHPFGRDAAKVACETRKINGPNAADLLEDAKKEVYQVGFYQGVMITGPFTGEKVAVAKVNTTKMLLEKDDAIRYHEPAKPVMSRSGDECVVAHCDQWYIEYGKTEWKGMVKEHLDSMNTYFAGIRHNFEETLDWLAEWPCSRTFGLGTYLPCDTSKTMLIDSLSDSTIYMAYYTVAQFFHVDKDGKLSLDGLAPNRYGITPSMITDATWDFVLKGVGSAEELHAATGLPLEVAKQMRAEFAYWYPVDLRVSAKDLIQNHLTMFLYNHAAIWPEDRSKWPRSIYCNGHICVDGEKMSKSKGNFISLNEALASYGADATRLACADSGDSLDDANFVRDNAQGFIMKLTTLLEQSKDLITKSDTFRSGEFSLFDQIFENTLNSIVVKTEQFYTGMSFRMALNAGFYELMTEFTQYKLQCDDLQMHAALVRRYVETITLLLMPLAPHFSEYMWTEVLGNATSVMAQPFPQPTAPVKFAMLVASRVINDVTAEIRVQVQKNAKKRGPIDEMYVYAAASYFPWQQAALKTLTAVYQENKNSFPADTAKTIIARKEAWMTPNLMQDAMAFISFMKQNVEKYGVEALSEEPVINDLETLQQVLPNIQKLSGVATVKILPREDESITEHKVARGKARPSEPTITFPPAPKK